MNGPAPGYARGRTVPTLPPKGSTVNQSGPLTLDDIADQRAYERERDDFRAQVIALKQLRRISVGPVISMAFENRLTMRFQVQEMARAEKMVTDAQIQHELDVYNKLLPEPGELSATLFLELTTEQELRTWLPKLVGVERSWSSGSGVGLTWPWWGRCPNRSTRPT